MLGTRPATSTGANRRRWCKLPRYRQSREGSRHVRRNRPEGVSSGRLCWENTLGFFDVKGTTVPAAVSVFPNELYQAPRSWAEAAYPNLIYFNEVDRGNHFAAWQEPDLFTSEVRAAFRSLR
jgi:hypothetical protein